MTKPRVFKYEAHLPEFLRDDDGNLYGKSPLAWARCEKDFSTLWKDRDGSGETYRSFWELLAKKGTLTEAFRPAAKPGDVIHTVEELDNFPNGTVIEIRESSAWAGTRVKISGKWFDTDTAGYSAGRIFEDEEMVLKYVPS